jgi:hypothetical protein
MAGNPDKTRQNALLSTGPRSAEGKAVVSQNRTTHGLLSTNPPLLDSEDYSTHQGILQGLIDQYQPVGPLEHHCIQQIAMCMLRQHRAWLAEATAGDRHAAAETLAQHYPEKATGVGFGQALDAILDGGTDRRAPTHPDVLGAERRALMAMASTIDQAWYGAPKGKAAFSKWCKRPLDDDAPSTLDNYTWAIQAIAKAAGECCKDYPSPAKPPAHDHGHLLMKIAGLTYIADEVPGYDSDFWANMAQWHRERSEAIAAEIAARVEEIDQALGTIEHLTNLTKRSHSISEEMELIGRYEARNARQLKAAIEQLQQLQAVRLNQAGISLNGNSGSRLRAV